jgi:hypothetical protein
LIVSVVVFAPPIRELSVTAAPFKYHWYVGAGVPPATTLNATFPPITGFCPTGCVKITGAEPTVKFAEADADPTPFVAVTRKVPAELSAFALASCTFASTSVEVFDPVTFPPSSDNSTPLRRHWYVGAGDPVATTVNVAFPPATVPTLTGGFTITGGTLSTIVALLLIRLVPLPVSTTRYGTTSAVVMFEIVSNAVVVPVYFDEFVKFVHVVFPTSICHWYVRKPPGCVGSGSTVNVVLPPSAASWFTTAASIDGAHAREMKTSPPVPTPTNVPLL